MTHILLVIDDADLSNMLRVYLHHQGYEITHVTDYTSGLDIVRDMSVQMVLFGVIENSDISRAEFVKRLGTSTSMIGMASSDEWREVFYSYSNPSYISIPFDIEGLHEIIKDELKRPR